MARSKTGPQKQIVFVELPTTKRTPKFSTSFTAAMWTKKFVYKTNVVAPKKTSII